MWSRDGSTKPNAIVISRSMRHTSIRRVEDESDRDSFTVVMASQTTHNMQDNKLRMDRNMQNQRKFPSPSTPRNRDGGNRDGNWVKKTPNQDSATNSPLAAPVTPSKDGDQRDGTKKTGAGGRSRLFIGNITEGADEDQMRKILEKYGKITELYVNGKRGFAFVKYVSINSGNLEWMLLLISSMYLAATPPCLILKQAGTTTISFYKKK